MCKPRSAYVGRRTLAWGEAVFIIACFVKQCLYAIIHICMFLSLQVILPTTLYLIYQQNTSCYLSRIDRARRRPTTGETTTRSLYGGSKTDNIVRRPCLLHISPEYSTRPYIYHNVQDIAVYVHASFTLSDKVNPFNRMNGSNHYQTFSWAIGLLLFPITLLLTQT